MVVKSSTLKLGLLFKFEDEYKSSTSQIFILKLASFSRQVLAYFMLISSVAGDHHIAK